ncbi:MAG: family N-acetyltransferase [Pedosphaera sp.]|nr:family N-acetyltransferase [Pedosphaera sp.]
MAIVTEYRRDGTTFGGTGQPAGVAAAPTIEAVRAHYRLRLATSQQDVRAAQLLRFVVFNLELREGLEQSYATCLDADAYDPICDHLLVEDVRTGEVIGTYRLQTGRTAAANLGYYSAQEFDFTPYEKWRQEIVELGRACVHSDHRNLTVLSLLWKGIANYVASRSCRYLIGCSSLTSQDPALGMAAYRELQPCLVGEEWRTNPLPAFACVAEAQAAAPKIPKLLSAYLALGSKICGPPAIDKEFKTIDFLTFMDLYSISPKTLARYLG